jgi:hypothetical protein
LARSFARQPFFQSPQIPQSSRRSAKSPCALDLTLERFFTHPSVGDDQRILKPLGDLGVPLAAHPRLHRNLEPSLFPMCDSRADASARDLTQDGL